jgi:hypothetical protein
VFWWRVRAGQKAVTEWMGEAGVGGAEVHPEDDSGSARSLVIDYPDIPSPQPPTRSGGSRNRGTYAHDVTSLFRGRRLLMAGPRGRVLRAPVVIRYDVQKM